MMKTAMIGAATALLMGSAAFAQTNPPAGEPAPPPPPLAGEALAPGGEMGEPGPEAGERRGPRPMQADRRGGRDRDRGGRRGWRDDDEDFDRRGWRGGRRGGEGAFFRIRPADGGPAIVIECADRDTTLECVNAIMPMLERVLPDSTTTPAQ